MVKLNVEMIEVALVNGLKSIAAPTLNAMPIATLQDVDKTVVENSNVKSMQLLSLITSGVTKFVHMIEL